ncbi:MAG: hypothetical protein A2V67_09255 [Deltaproteobacteria bacterium RBG_13_61_14]|nr:MAG: hypothetical protein A2V67_09255 [Deltaproteobacteria bacterium RBG_13_61_14]
MAATFLNSGLARHSLVETPWRVKAVSQFAADYHDPGFNDRDWLEQKLPGQWQMLPELQDHAGRVVYRTRFPFSRQAERLYRLRCHGVFYGADVYLNSHHLGHHAGYFDPFDFPINDVLESDNLLVVEVESCQEENRAAKKQITGVFGHWDVISFCHNPGGIWLPVEIVETGPACLDRVQFQVLELAAENARVRFNVDLTTLEPCDLDLWFELVPQNFEGAGYKFRRQVRAPVGPVRLSEESTLTKPELWWCHDRGLPHLYRASITMLCHGRTLDRQTFNVGLRTVSADDRLRFRLNGQGLYIKGNNYAPSDVYLARTSPADLVKDVAMMAEAGYNMVRVHAHVDRPEFYDECDRQGILVWQDFPLQWGYHRSVFPEARRQVRAMVRLLENHPAIALWCCHNEPSEVGITLHDFRFQDVVRSLPGFYHLARGGGWNLRVLDPALAAAAAEEDSSRPINLASGNAGTDKHYYCGWYYPIMGDADRFRKFFLNSDIESLGFITEFGAQAFPGLESSLRFIPAELSRIDWTKLRRDHLYQDRFLRRYVDRRGYTWLSELVDASQDYQARLLKFHVEWLRSVKYHLNFGIIAFLHNDSQPAVTWSVVDYWRQPKKAYHALLECFRPIWAFATPRFSPYPAGRTARIPLFAANDTLEAIRQVSFRAELRRDHETIAQLVTEVDLQPDMPSRRVGELTFTPSQPGTLSLEVSMSKPPRVEVKNLYEIRVAATKRSGSKA